MLTFFRNSCGCSAIYNVKARQFVKAKWPARMLDKKKKDRIIAKYRTHESDTGSPQVQIALLTAEMKELSEHLLDHKKDFSSRKGLLRKVSERRRLLKYLKREDAKAYGALTADLKLKA